MEPTRPPNTISGQPVWLATLEQCRITAPGRACPRLHGHRRHDRICRFQTAATSRTTSLMPTAGFDLDKPEHQASSVCALTFPGLQVPPRPGLATAYRPAPAASAAARCMLDDISLVTVLCSSTAAAVDVTYSLTS